MSVVKNKNGRGILLAMVHAIQQNKQLLGDVDGLIGDGDHGMNMNKGFTLYEEQLGDQDTSLSDGLFDLGSVLLNKIGGSMGPIYGTIFMEMSSVIEDVEDITLETFSEMLRSGLDGLYEIVDARPGDKTLVDTLYPVCQYVREAANVQTDFSCSIGGDEAGRGAGKAVYERPDGEVWEGGTAGRAFPRCTGRRSHLLLHSPAGHGRWNEVRTGELTYRKGIWRC